VIFVVGGVEPRNRSYSIPTKQKTRKKNQLISPLFNPNTYKLTQEEKNKEEEEERAYRT
jgi:hypothetical protein